jgi:hypothetical protein
MDEDKDRRTSNAGGVNPNCVFGGARSLYRRLMSLRRGLICSGCPLARFALHILVFLQTRNQPHCVSSDFLLCDVSSSYRRDSPMRVLFSPDTKPAALHVL